MKIKIINNLEKKPNKKKIYLIDDYQTFNLEYDYSYNEMLKINRGDILNELNFIKNLKELKKTVYINQKFLFGDSSKKPEISIVRGDIALKRKNIPRPKFYISTHYDSDCDGIYCITQSYIEAIQDKKSLLYPHVYDIDKFEEINSKPIILIEQKIKKDWYNWASDEKIKKLRKKYYPNDNTFIICICGRIATNSYPKNLLEAILRLRKNKIDVQLLVLAELKVSPYRLTKEEYDEITSYDWVKSFTVPKKQVLNYYRMCDVLASTYRDYCNVVGGSNKIKEFLLCDKPILCSRGKERERELGEQYMGFYDCEDCYKIPPLSWTKEFLNNKKNMEIHFDLNNRIINEIIEILEIILKKKIIIIITSFNRNMYLKNTINMLKIQNYKNYTIRIIDDDTNNILNFNEKNIKHIKNKFNYGKNYYYKNFAKNIRSVAYFSDKYLFMVDDLTFDDNFLNLSILYWNSIIDDKKICLTLINDRNLSWTNKKNKKYNSNVLISYWQETFFICDNKFIKIYYNFDIIFNKPEKLLSSGVPRFFSIYNNNNNLKMFVVKNNFINNIGNFNSSMNNEIIIFKDRIKEKYKKEKIKLLIVSSKNGLHFMKKYIEFIEKISCIELQIDDNYEYVSNKYSMKYFKQYGYSDILQKKLDDFNPDIIFCEWGNFLLYELANRKKSHQKLICRMHRFDIYLIPTWNVKYENVDKIICISKYFANLLKERNLKTNIVTINNYFDLKIICRNENEYDFYNIGIIGIENIRKRFDLALKILIELRKYDSNFKLFSKGKNLDDVKIINGLDKTNWFHEDHSDDNNISVNQWLINNKITHILSTSDNESFHYSIVSAIENNCNYYITNWSEIAKTMWRSENIYENINDVVNAIINFNNLNFDSKKNIFQKNIEDLLLNFEPNNENIFLSEILN